METAKLRTIGLNLVMAGMAGLLIAGCGRDKSPEAKSTGQTQSKSPAPVPELVSTPSPVQGDPSTSQVTVEKPAPPVAASYAEAEAAYFDGRYAEAAGLFQSYTAAHPDNVIGHYMLGLSLWKDGKGKEAEVAFNRTLELKPTHVKSLTNLARVLLDEGRAEEALPLINRAVDIDPGNGDALRVRGRAYHNLGMAEQAIDSYRKAIALNDQDTWALNNLGLVLIETGRPEEAVAPLARATRIKSGVAVFHNNLGIALEQAGRYGAAARAFTAALEADSSYSKATTNLARVEALKEDPGLAELDLTALGDGFRVESVPVPEPQAERVEERVSDPSASR